jgi:hypothetical protein
MRGWVQVAKRTSASPPRKMGGGRLIHIFYTRGKEFAVSLFSSAKVKARTALGRNVSYIEANIDPASSPTRINHASYIGSVYTDTSFVVSATNTDPGSASSCDRPHAIQFGLRPCAIRSSARGGAAADPPPSPPPRGGSVGRAADE